MASKDKGRQQQEDAAKAAAAASQVKADTAVATAAAPDPLEQRRRDFVGKVLDWREGKNGPIDIKDFPDQSAIALYNNAKTVHDAGRVGKGYGTLAGGANPNFSAALDKENEMERQQAASGDLENQINGELASADAETGNLWGAADSRNMGLAGMLNSNAENANNRYMQLLMQPKPPSFLKQLAGGLIGNISYAPKGGAFGLAGLAV